VIVVEPEWIGQVGINGEVDRKTILDAHLDL